MIIILGAPLGGRGGNTGLAGYDTHIAAPGLEGLQEAQPKRPRRTLGRVPLADPRAAFCIAPPLPSGAGTTTSASHSLGQFLQMLAASAYPKRKVAAFLFLNKVWGKRGIRWRKGPGASSWGPREEWAWPLPTQPRCGDCSLARRAMHFVWLGRKRPPP